MARLDEKIEPLEDTFRYVYSSSLDNRVQIKIGTLEGTKPKISFEKLLNDPLLQFSGIYLEECPSLMVKMQVFNLGKPFGLPVTTSYKAFTTRWNWNEWVTLPVQFSDLPKTAVLAIWILDCAGSNRTNLIGSTTISMFGKCGLFRQGMYDLRVWTDKQPDCNIPSTTPGKGKDLENNQMQRLAKLTKKHRNGQLQKAAWLDRLTFREIETINYKEKTDSEHMYLLIEFPTVYVDDKPYSIVYYEPDGDYKYSYISKPKLVTVPDSEILQENLVELKHHKLARSNRYGSTDRKAKPTANERDRLHNIIHRYPPTYNLSGDEQDLVWKFRFYLANQKKALTKVLKCINWSTQSEVQQALDLLNHWVPIDVEDALELFTPVFTHPAVRKYAISRLNQAPEEDLLLYLLQLVEALKYENFNELDMIFKQLIQDNEVLTSIDDNNSDQLTISDSVSGSELNQSTSRSEIGQSMRSEMVASSSMQSTMGQRNMSVSNSSEVSRTVMDESPCQNHLALFLIHRASNNITLANYFYWYLYIECENMDAIHKQDEQIKNMYLKVMRLFKRTLQTGNSKAKAIRVMLENQQLLIDELVKLVKLVAKESGNRKKKMEKFQQLLNEPDAFRINFKNFEPMQLPLDPSVMIKGIYPEKVTLFKSALMPAKITFSTTQNVDYVTIFKYGDDLRQDQLILQMITLMDKLLRRENLDLKLTPYRVLATSSKHGLLQYIDSVPVAEVLNTEGSIQNFFRKHHPSENGPFGISSSIMDAYTRSCAGYCVITYLLGVGDRHLDNLLLTTSGNLFHIDFGYILGRDPKPMPPPMKLSREMVEGMGGINSEQYKDFLEKCYTAYLHLRRHANVMINLFSLMEDASVPDIALEPDKAVKKIEEKLYLNKSDEEAISHFQTLLDMSVTAIFPAFVEQIHKIAQYLRK